MNTSKGTGQDARNAALRGSASLAAAHWQAKRVVIFGLDAVSWDVVDRLGSAMPTLSRLRREGHAGVLRSTLPPITPVAWTSMVTGVQPGKHGIYEFVHRTEKGWRPVTRRQTRAATLDELLEASGRSSILVNLPVSNPGRSGAIRLQDFLSADPEPVEPVALKGEAPELAAYRPFYAPGAIADRSIEDMVAEVSDLESRRLEATRYLVRTKPWQFLFYGVTGTDHLQHRALHEIMGPGPVPESIASFYRQVDGALSWTLDQMQGGDLLIVASDHGSAVLQRELLLNQWLVTEGLAQWKAAAAAPAKAGQAGSGGRRLFSVLKRMAFALGLDTRTARLRRRLGIRVRIGGGPVAEIDEDRSAAYMPTSFAWPALYTPGVDPRQLAGRLAALVDPKTKERVFEAVLTADEAYGSERAPDAPDLVLMPAPGMAVHPGRAASLFRDVTKNHHKRDGIVVLYGGRSLPIAKDLGVRQVEDIAPTVLAAMGVPVPEAMDGASILPLRPADNARRAVRQALSGILAGGELRLRQPGGRG